MAARQAELVADREKTALSKLQAAAGLIDKSQVERLDWMYEQSAASVQKTEEELMNTPVADQKDKDLQDIKQLGESTAGSLFLKSATRTTEDMLRKLREDPLFQIRRQEQAARESMMANPLIRARLQKKAEKQAKKVMKKEKKAAKKEKKAAKKAAKKAKKALRKGSSSSSSSSDDSSATAAAGDAAHSKLSAAAGHRQGPPRQSSPRRASPSPPRRASPPRRSSPRQESRPRRAGGGDAAVLGPGSHMVNKREEYAARLAERKDAALASRGAPRRMDEAEKRRRLEQMQMDAAKHEKFKDLRIAEADMREKAVEELEAKMRMNSDQSYLRGMRQDAYMESSGTVADRLKNQRHRRQKHINDPLERDD